ncbi:MAG: ABC transporter ATP-binding protein [Microvirga sp.]
MTSRFRSKGIAPNTSSMLGFTLYAWSHLRRQLGGVLVLMLFASLTEGVSLLLLVPILKLINPTHPSAHLAVPTGRLAPLLGSPLMLSLGAVLIVFVLAITLRALLTRHKDIATAAFLYDLVNQLRDELFRAIAGARWAHLARVRGSDINHALTADIDRVQMAAAGLLQLLQTGIIIGVYALVALVLSPIMTLVALVIGAIVLVLLSPIRRLATRYGTTLTSQRQEQYRIVSEFVGGVKLAKASNTEPLYVEQLSGTLFAMRHGTLHFMRLFTIGTLLFQIGTAIGLAIFIWLAVGHFAVVYSSLITLVLLFMRIGPRVAAVHGSVQSVLSNLPALTAMLAMRDTCRAEAEPPRGTAPGPVAARQIVFDHVSFAYGDGEAETDAGGPRGFALHDVSFVLPAKEITAIIGPSGSGKSTIADALMGLIEPASGAIRADDTTLGPNSYRAWRDSIAYVPQDSFLWHDTIARNLRVGRDELTDATLWEALEFADAANLVRKLPQGLETVVGDRGLRLSGGERQRIALARALLRNPQLLVLDEATSALDWESQAAIANSIRRLRGHMTVVTIAHRPSMVAFADWVVAIQDGCVVQHGAYAELAAQADGYLNRVIAGDR